MSMALGDAERVDWIALARAPRIGPVTFFQLLSRYGTPGAALKALPSIKTDKTTAASELEATLAV